MYTFQLITSMVIFLLYLLVSILLGIAVSVIFKLKNTLVEQMMMGFFVYQVLFSIFVIPLKFKVVPVNVIGGVWFTILFLILCLTLKSFRRDILNEMQKEYNYILKCKGQIRFVIGYLVFLVVFYEVFGRINAGVVYIS